jgi:signal transduction histidine kinase
MGGPNAWLLTDRIVVYNEVLLGRASLDRLPVGVLLWSPSGMPLYANTPAREWLDLDTALPDWATFWRRFAGSEAAVGERGELRAAGGGADVPRFLYVTDRVRNLEGQEVALAAYVARPAEAGATAVAPAPGLPVGDRTLALLLFRDGRLSAWSPLSPRWPALDASADETEGRVLERLSREVEAGRAPQFVPARETLSDGSVLILAQSVEEQAAAGAAFRHEQLVAATAHEIRNPLATIRGFLQILPGSGPEERARYAAIAMREVDRIIDVVNDFLQGGNFADTETPPVNLVTVGRTAVEAVQAEIAGAGLDIGFGSDTDEILVRGRSTRLAQVVTNLLHNAVESVSAPGGHVWVGIEADNTWARLAVEDDGPGVPEEWLDAVFDPAFSRRPGGHGLGLAIARWIVTSHGGRIACGRSRAGGARFEVVLPRAPLRTANAGPAAAAPSA